MKYIDLYAGIGGFRQAFDKYNHECVFTAEIDGSAIQTYEENYNDNAAFDLDSLNSMTNEEINLKIPDHDILVGGFPCQSFSVGGKREGFKTSDTKGTQFYNILKILDIKKPKYIFLENVKNLFKHDSGNTWKIIKKEIETRGYLMPEKEIILSPNYFGIPQNRERVFIIGIKGIKPKNFEYKKSEKMINPIKNNEKNINYILSEKEIKVLNAWKYFIKNVKFPFQKTLPVIWLDEMRNNEKINEKWPLWRKKYYIEMRKFYSENKKFIDKWCKENSVDDWNKRDKKLEWQAGKDNFNIEDTIVTFRQSGIRCKSKPIFPTLVAMVQTPIIFDTKINSWRRITPREAARLQSFPEKFKINPSDYQAYKQFGNAVNVKVVEKLIDFYFNN